jgi:apolipoprotein N-acyltransferase
VLGFAPFHLWPLLFLTLPAYVWLLDGVSARGMAGKGKPRWREAAIAGWWFGFGFFAAGLYWIGFAFFVEAEKFAALLPLAVAGLPAALALFPALASAAAMLLWREGAARIFVIACAFFAADWLRGHMLTGFPWNLWGYALAGNDAIAQSASIFGIYGLTLLALIVFASPAALSGPAARAGGRFWLLPAICLALVTAGWVWGAARLSAANGDTLAGVPLRLVQANIPQAEKWKPENRQWIFNRLVSLSGQPPAADASGGNSPLLIWPETSVPFLFMINRSIASEESRRAFADLVASGHSFIVGAERVEGKPLGDGRYTVERAFNSLFVLDAEARVEAIYDKIHLVPFGEYLPFEETLGAIGLKKLTRGNSGFATGTERQPLKPGNAPAFSPLICYEAIFPGRVTGTGARPGWLLNLTNDAWFGISTGPYQHLHQARLRAIEEGLPLIRAANTGVSAVIDAYGRIKASLPLDAIGVIDHPLPVALEPTPYARWGENWLIMMAFLIFILYRIVIQVE